MQWGSWRAGLRGHCHCDTPPSPLLPALEVLFAEEPGLVLEVPQAAAADICLRYQEAGVSCLPIGHTGPPGPQATVRELGVRSEGYHRDGG